MNEMAYIALVLFVIGLALIVSGLIGIYRNRNSKESVEANNDEPAPEQSKGPSQNGSVLQRMQHDEKLKQKILEEIEKKSE